jgi:LysM repeat protein
MPRSPRAARAVLAAVVVSLVVGGASADYTVQAGDTLAEIARQSGVSISELAATNGITNPDLIRIGQQLIIPGSPAGGESSVHQVAPGENLAKIAALYGTTVQALTAANGLGNPDLIRIGQQLALPGAATPPTTGGVVGGGSSAGTHVVKQGESLASIAAQHGTTVQVLAAANGITDGSTIYAGTRLRLSGEPFVAAPHSGDNAYVITGGDTLSGIAIRFGTSIAALASANQLDNLDLIQAGQTIKVPNQSWVCPVVGGTYFNDWGFPRGGGRAHEGNDLFAARGTEVRAPVGGTVEQLSGRIGGLQFRLYGDDGHLYIGTHLDTFGQGGSVAAGTVIGYVGDSGNAIGSRPHLHFEIHPNGAAPVNPYPTLKNFGC